MSDRLEHVEESLRTVIETLNDGHKGFSESGKHIQDTSIKTFFLEESKVRTQFATELQDQLYHLGVKKVDEDGTPAGALHRAWAGMKATLGGGDHTLLVTAEQGEDEAKEAYQRALGAHLPAAVDALLRKQQQHIIQAHNKVRAWRDAKNNE
jgi:uncharacterized protein (TIGR02284 family)